jgi:hypothetical protein
LDAKTKKFGFLKKKKMGNAYYCPSSVWLSFFKMTVFRTV